MLDRILPSKQIEYLVLRRYPAARSLNIAPSIGYRRHQAGPDLASLRSEVATYRTLLSELAWDDLVARYDEEKRVESQELRERLDHEEQERFFNQPGARADYDYWSKIAYWSLDEAIALSFGKAPELVRWEKLQAMTMLGSPFVGLYSRRRALALRAVGAKQLSDPVWPGNFLAWAKRVEIEVPSDLLVAVERRGIQVADWKALYDQAMAAIKVREDASQELLEAKDGLIAALKTKIETLVAESAKAAEPSEKALGTKERDSLLKMVAGMARDNYQYDPKAGRSRVAQEISDDLAKHGILLDADTVRKWLKEAAEQLPTQSG